MLVWRKPKRCSNHGVVSIESVIAAMKPAERHCARSWPSANTRVMSGTATLMMVEA